MNDDNEKGLGFNNVKVDNETFIERILELLVLISFIVLTVIIGKKHEPWADEAQAWLLARDASIKDLITTKSFYKMWINISIFIYSSYYIFKYRSYDI